MASVLVASSRAGPGRLWAAAAGVAALGTAILFDAAPGINWALWTAAAVLGLHAVAAPRGAPPAALRALGAITVVVAGAAGVTASDAIVPLVAVSVALLLALQVRIAAGAPLAAVTAGFAAATPVVAVRAALAEAARRGEEATALIRTERTRTQVRGVAITVPVMIAFAALLAEADPLLAAGVEAIARWEAAPRAAFFAALLVVVLGAYGVARRAPVADPPAPLPPPHRWIGATERTILLGGVAALFWAFVALQVSYLFGVSPQAPGSGVTFAEYARRGFAELTVVATASALLIVGVERVGHPESRTPLVRALTLAVLAAVALLLASAVRRVTLYQAAYGYTTARLFAQVYMGVVAAGLVLLTREVVGRFDAGRLFRGAAAVALAAFVGLGYWNHEAWVAHRNLDRAAATGTLDVRYLTRDLSLDALPAIADRVPLLPAPLREELRRAVAERHAARPAAPRAWYEWNRAAARARESLALFLAAPAPAPVAAAATAAATPR